MADECAFCPNPADSREHLWAEWIGELLGPRQYTITRTEPDGTSKTWPATKLDLKTWEVCHKCNSGWMSDLESRTRNIVKDMIVQGKPRILEIRDLQTIASLVFIKAVIADRISDVPPFLSRAARFSFRRTLTIPPGTQMWLASLPTSYKGIYKGFYLETPGTTSNDFKAQVFTLAAGHLAVQAAISRWRKRTAGRETNEISLTQHPIWGDVSIAFWPSNGNSIAWPPRKNLLGIEVDEFINRWCRLVRS